MSKNKINQKLDQFFSSIDTGHDSNLTASVEPKTQGYLWQADNNGLYISCEYGITEVLGFSPEEMIGNPLVSFQLPLDEQTKIRERLNEADFPIEIELIFITKSGSNQKLRLTIFQNLDESQNLIGYHGFNEQLIYDQEIRTATLEPFAIESIEKEDTKKLHKQKSTYVENKKQKKSVKKTGTTNQLEKPFKTGDTKELQQQQQNNNTRNLSPSPTSPLVLSNSTSSFEEQILPVTPRDLSGYSLVKNQFEPSITVWTAQAQSSFDENKLIAIQSVQGSPAILAVPLRLRNEKTGVIEIIDDQSNRIWTSEEQFLLQEVARQLGSALENTQLYASLQRELSERVKAEREALRRNKDLTNLQLISSDLNQLINKEQIFEIISGKVQQLMGTNNLLLSLYDQEKASISFPISVVNSIPSKIAERQLIGGYQEEIIRSKKPLLINRNLASTLKEAKIDHSNYLPFSLLAVPLIANDLSLGVLSIFDYQNEDAFDQSQVELLSSAASQIATALQNINLFSEISDAFSTIENRQKIQSYVTDAVAQLGTNGSSQFDYVLKSLIMASNSEFGGYFESQIDGNQITYWQLKNQYSTANPSISFDNLQQISTKDHTGWLDQLSKNGWHSTNLSNATASETKWLETNHFGSVLLLSVKQSDQAMGGFIALGKADPAAEWKTEEIELYSVVSEAFGNTLIRESLVEKLQNSLVETENLYAASHRLALADSMQEMISAIVTSFSESNITRGEIILFDYNLEGNISRIMVAANYFNGDGTPPTIVGAEYSPSQYAAIFSSQFPTYLDDLQNWNIEPNVKQSFLDQQIRSMAILPLWSGSVQIGVLLLQTCQEYRFSKLEIRSYPPLIDQMATAIQNLRLFESTQSALAETELLYKISSGITRSVDMNELIQLVGENAMPKNCDSMFLFVVYRERTSETSEYDLAGAFSSELTPNSIPQRISADAISFIRFPSAEPTLIRNTDELDLPAAGRIFFKKSGLKSLYLIPLQTASNPVGFLMAGSSHLISLDEKESHTLQTIGNNVAVAIERQHLLFEAQRRALELQTAAEIARESTSTLSQEILLSRIVNLLKDRFGYYHCSIFLLDDDNKYAVVQESTGEAGKAMKQNKHKLAVGSKSVIGTCLASGQPVVVNDTSLSPVFYPNPLLLETRSEMGIPLKIGGRIIGALDLQSKTTNGFSENEITVLKILSDQISVAIENARAFAISQQAVQEMRELDRVKSQFLANMSHELRTPLNSVIGFSRVILKGIDGPINKVQEQDITAIYNSGMNLLNMINEILDLSKIEAGKMELQLEEISLVDVINKAISTATGLIKDKPIQLIQEIPTDLPLIRGDQIKLGQVVLNLLSNAIKFTEKGTIKIVAALSKDAKLNPEVMVSVIDSGVGIAVEDQSKLFQRFSQVDDSPTRKTGGTGLGLSISRSLIEMHGGKIGLLSSAPGKGSVFFFTLPVAGLTKGLDASQLSHGENVILSIDDDPQVIELYERYLRNYGFDVVGLTNPAKALEKTLELKPFAITLDIMMPEVDGWQVLNDLKQDERTRDIPILVCSIVEDEEKGFNLGASDYLVKPFLQGDLINAIHRINRDNSSLEVLIIDDDPDDLKFVKKMVEAEPSFHPTLAQGGKIALDVLNNLTPDLIILDLFMPDMNGFELLDYFKSEPRLARIPVIVLTGAELSPEQKNQLTESSRVLSTHGLLKESDILKNMEEALQKMKTMQK